MNREDWLHKVAHGLAPAFADLGYDLPQFRITCGFPSKHATSRRKRSVGQCFESAASEDAHHEILISPVLAEPMEIAGVIAHELVHAVLPPGTGHKGKFPVVCRRLGLEGKPTSMTVGPEFEALAAPLLVKAGDYPHARLNAASPERKQGTRMIKCVCADCGYVARTTAKWLNEAGAPICPADNRQMDTES